MTREIEIPFNKPFIAGKELYYIAQAVTMGNISGDGHYTQKCSRFLESRFGIERSLLTPSCTAALELAAQLCEIGPGDEVIMPSYTFVSTANAVARLGARPVFVDIRRDTLNIDETLIEEQINARTKAIFPVHYAGVGCQMDAIMSLAEKHGLKVVEDAAQGVNATFRNRALGSIGHLGTYSFHETKNYICGEGGALCINSPELIERAEILRDKGTNRQKFFRGEVDKYSWVDLGSSFVPSEICSAFLFGQLELIDEISERRRQIFENYRQGLESIEVRGRIRLPVVPIECGTNYHMFHLLLESAEDRESLRGHLASRGIHAVIHYVPLHSSQVSVKQGYWTSELPVTDEYSSRLLRLPFFHDLSSLNQGRIIEEIEKWTKSK